MDKRKFASYSCFVIFSLIDMIITMLIPSIAILFLSMLQTENHMIFICLLVFFIILSTVFCYCIPIILTSVQFYLKKELFKIQLFLLIVSLCVPICIIGIIIFVSFINA